MDFSTSTDFQDLHNDYLIPPKTSTKTYRADNPSYCNSPISFIPSVTNKLDNDTQKFYYTHLNYSNSPERIINKDNGNYQKNFYETFYMENYKFNNKFIKEIKIIKIPDRNSLCSDDSGRFNLKNKLYDGVRGIENPYRYECFEIKAKKIYKDVKFTKRELITQTKAYTINKNLSPVTGLKVKGIVKNISIRKNVKNYCS